MSQGYFSSHGFYNKEKAVRHENNTLYKWHPNQVHLNLSNIFFYIPKVSGITLKSLLALDTCRSHSIINHLLYKITEKRAEVTIAISKAEGFSLTLWKIPNPMANIHLTS